MDNVGTSGSENMKQKKPFDKKKWREQKYSKHNKIEQWQERRKKAALHKYRKTLKKELPTEKPGVSFQDIPDERIKRPNRYQAALLEYERIQEERRKQKEEAMQAAAERRAAEKVKRKLRSERNRKLSKRTAKGQPVLHNQIDILLEKIERMQ